MDQINREFSENIIGKGYDVIGNEEELTFLNESKGPVWYRGYFTDTSFCESRLDSILDFYDKDHVVIGHTPNNGIVSLFHGKILAADAGIMYKQPDEMLMYKDGCFYKAFINGTRIKL